MATPPAIADKGRLLSGGRLALAALLVASIGGGFWLSERYLNPSTAQAFTVSQHPLNWTVRGPGLVDATNKVSLTAKMQGRLSAVNVVRNQAVHAGEILAKLEADEIKSQLTSAEAEADAASSAVGIAESNEVRAKAVLERLQADLGRRKQLAVTGVISKVEIETLQSTLRQAEAEWRSAQTSILRTEAQMRAAGANVKVIKARLEETIIRSPMNGVVVQRDRNVGDVALPGAIILQLVEPSSIIVSARFDESNMGAISQGRSARVVFVSAPRTEYPGKVLRIGRLVDEETREFTADVTLEELPVNWALGQRATVLVETTTDPNLLLAPQRFIQRQSGKPSVWVLDGSRARKRAVVLGAAIGPYVEIRSGVATDEVLIDPVGRYAYEPVRAQFSWQ